MLKISNYSLNYSARLRSGEMDLFGFLSLCRQMGLEGAALHVRDLASTDAPYLKRVRRAYLDNGLSISMFSDSNDFGRAAGEHDAELRKAEEAIRIAVFLGAPILRVFAGSPPNEEDRRAAFERSVAAVRQVCQRAADVGLPVGLQNHNHGALCRTGEDVIRFIKEVGHPNLTFILDCGQFAGSQGASGGVPAELRESDYLESIRQTASLARHVQVKFYNPRADGSEPWIDYDRVLDVLQSVHYHGFIDIVYEPGRGKDDPGEAIDSAIPRIVMFLRSKIQQRAGLEAVSQSADVSGRYARISAGRFIEDAKVQAEISVAFLEGPAVDRAGNVFFSNIAAQRILKWEPSQKKLSVFRERSNRANGLLFDPRGRLLACEGGGRLTRTDIHTGELTVLAQDYESHPLGAPNDLALDALGRIYFTSRLPNCDPAVGNVNAVYRLDGSGSLARVLAWPAIDMPNGIVTSPDDKLLYLIDADGSQDGARRIRAYDLEADGTVGRERTIYDFYPGRSGDGMCIDAEGNLYVAAGLHRRRGSAETLDTKPGLHVISPEGNLLDFIETPEDTITNCTFGGPDLRTLYVTCGKLLLSMPARVPGKSSYRPRA